MNIKPLTLAIVIPVYNEQRYLKACLDAIALQTEMPDEVIVVDNNSTDSTPKIAKGYSFVTLLHEPRQHQVFAQAAGFNHAKSDILARIDADSIIGPDWAANVKKAFSASPQADAFMGPADPYDTNSKNTSLFFFNTYYAIARLIAGHRLLFGANCALRRSAWQKIRGDVIMRPDIWEDYDLAFALAKAGGHIGFLPDIPAGISLRSAHKPLSVQFEYHFRALRTFYLRTNPLKSLIFLLVLSLGSLLIVYPLTVVDRLLNRQSDASRRTMAEERG